jgi:hypothetical protein
VGRRRVIRPASVVVARYRNGAHLLPFCFRPGNHEQPAARGAMGRKAAGCRMNRT